MRRNPVERLAAWLLCGPVGHFVAGLTDVVDLSARYWWSRLRARRGARTSGPD